MHVAEAVSSAQQLSQSPHTLSSLKESGHTAMTSLPYCHAYAWMCTSPPLFHPDVCMSLPLTVRQSGCSHIVGLSAHTQRPRIPPPEASPSVNTQMDVLMFCKIGPRHPNSEV